MLVDSVNILSEDFCLFFQLCSDHVQFAAFPLTVTSLVANYPQLSWFVLMILGLYKCLVFRALALPLCCCSPDSVMLKFIYYMFNFLTPSLMSCILSPTLPIVVSCMLISMTVHFKNKVQLADLVNIFFTAVDRLPV